MSNKSKIEWTDRTWNPVTGCSKISEACDNCYAERMATRLAGRYGYPEINPFDVTVHYDRLSDPCNWTKPCKVFVCSMSDLFHPSVPENIIHFIFGMMSMAPEWTFQILTKRPERAKEVLRPLFERYRTISNVCIGVTGENQACANHRIPHLMEIPAAKTFVSVEPILGPVDLSYFLDGCPSAEGDAYNPTWVQTCPPLDWVICGGESGPKARPTHPMWVQELRDQCKNSRVPFFFKQWGEWVPKTQWTGKFEGDKFATLDRAGNMYYQTTTWNGRDLHPDDNYETIVYNVGKKNAGALLDGKEWKQFPKN